MSCKIINNHIPIDINDEENDCFESKKIADCLAEKITSYIDTKKNEDISSPIIGLFGKYGEGKSTIIRSLEKSLQKECIYTLEIDVWKYDLKDIKENLHKVYKLEDDMLTTRGNVKQIFFYLLSRVWFKRKDDTLGLSKSFLHYQHNLYKDISFKKILSSIFSSRKKIKCKNKVLICLENLDRCTKEKKVALLSAVYNFRDWFEHPFLIAIDPHSVDHQTDYFEDLIKKVFTTSIYVYQKTKINLHKYISKIDILDDKMKELLNKYIYAIYPVTPRDINHILNVYFNKSNNEKYSHKNMFMSILHVEWRELYHEISKNPFLLQFYVESSQKDNLFNYYEHLNYDEFEAKRINKLVLEFVNNLDDKLEVYQIYEGISPLIPKNTLEVLDKSTINIMAMQLDAKNYYEVKNHFKRYELNLGDDVSHDIFRELFLLCLKDSTMLQTIFFSSNYMNVAKEVVFSNTEKKQILNAFTVVLNLTQSINVASFILEVFQDDIDKYKKEFALLLYHHSTLFLEICNQLYIMDKARMSDFIYNVYSDELYKTVSELPIKNKLDFYQYFIKAYFIMLNKHLSDSEYTEYSRKLYNDLFDNRTLQSEVFKESLFIEYCGVLENIKGNLTLENYSGINRFIKINDMSAENKLILYYQFLKYMSAEDEGLAQEFIFVLYEITQNQQLIAKYDYILSDYDVLHRDIFVKNHKITIREIILNIFAKLDISRSQNIIFEGLPKYMFEYLEEEDFQILEENFNINKLGYYIIHNGVRNDLFYDFIISVIANQKLNVVEGSINLVEEIIIEIYNLRKPYANNNFISFSLSYEKNQDKKLDREKGFYQKVLENIDFSKIDINELKKDIGSQSFGIDTREEYKLMQIVDKYFMKEMDIKDLREDLKSFFKYDCKNLMAKLVFARAEYNFKDYNIEIYTMFSQVVFELYEEDSEMFLPLVILLEKKLITYGVKDKKILEIVSNFGFKVLLYLWSSFYKLIQYNV